MDNYNLYVDYLRMKEREKEELEKQKEQEIDNE